MAEASPQMEEYFGKINDEVLKIYAIANAAKSKGHDPDEKVAIPHAKNMAERVEGLISTVAPQIIGSGVTTRIAELETQYGSQDWRVALQIALEVAQEKFCKFKTKLEAMEIGIRTGFSYVTVGVVSSPLEGFTQLKLKKRNDNAKEYFCLMYSGPIRSAGGTGASVSVLIADYIRKNMGYATYDPTENEIKRAYTELTDYHDRVTRLQYFPSREEIEFLISHLPVEIDGDESEKYEVSNYKDLPRVEANRIRNGYCLMTAECLSLKAPKVLKQLSKWGKELGFDDWAFWDEFVKLQKEMKAKGLGKEVEKEDNVKIKPDWTYLKDLAAGRPVFAYPQREGGFRLRYGRSRTSGFSMNAIHPATMIISNDCLAFGTQLKMERPGKSTVLAACDTIDGPIVKLKNGNVRRLNTVEIAKKYDEEIGEIIYLGDMLVCYGDFLNRNHILVPCAFNEEWWALYLEKADKSILSINKERIDEIIEKPYKSQVTFEETVEISEKLGIPFHPRYIFFWNGITFEQLEILYNQLKKAAQQEGKLIIPNISEESKRALEILGVEHTVVPNEYVLIEKEEAQALLANLGQLERTLERKNTVLESVNSISKFKIKDKLGTFLGARMGRPEKAKARQMKGTPHALFPVGKEGGRLRSFQSALSKGKIQTDMPFYVCENCNNNTIYPLCEKCNTKTKRKYVCRQCNKEMWEDTCSEHGPCMGYKRQNIDICYYYNSALQKLNMPSPPLVKGIKGTSNQDHTPEHLAKGIIRAKYGLNIFKEGTIRFDMTETVCTHFKPKEIGTSVARLKEIGYTYDVYGKELTEDNQTLELKAQDIILPGNEGAKDEGADKVIINICGFLDELLLRFYGLPAYYNVKTKEDIIGHLTAVMSPHTASCMVARIIGFSRTQGFMAHPLLHSILRRDCDGDEAAIMMLLDTLLNFSKKFLPNRRGSTQDAPLVLTSKLIPSEVDDMVFDMDIAWKYPLELYEAAEEYKKPFEIKVEKLGDHLGTERQYEGMGFTHDTDDVNAGVLCSSYKLLPTMQEKILSQMDLAKKLRAVNENDVAKLIIEKHFMKDIKGNLRHFSMQQFRCVDCNEKFRRPPLRGKCSACNGKIIFTIAEGSVIKYVEPALELARKYNLPAYLKQSLELTKNRIESVFGKDSEKQEALGKWFG
ncbi:MAG: DNA polymerase II large subunit [archaeon]